VWPDKNDCFPGDPGFQQSFDGMQPLLWLPRDDNPPSRWTGSTRPDEVPGEVTLIVKFHLDAATATYRLHAVHRSVLDLEQPVRLTLPLSELVTA